MKLDLDTLPIVPTVPPEAGPDRAFDAPPEAGRDLGLDPTVVVFAVLAAAEPPLVALTMPPLTAMAVMPTAMVHQRQRASPSRTKGCTGTLRGFQVLLIARARESAKRFPPQPDEAHESDDNRRPTDQGRAD
jgi:hypothetical protein